MKMSKFGMPSFLGLSNIAKGFIIPKFLARLWEFSLWEIHEPSFGLINDYEKEIFLCDSILGLVVSTWARSLVVGHEVEWSTVVYVCHKLFNLCVDVHSFFLAVLVAIACLFLVLLFARVDWHNQVWAVHLKQNKNLTGFFLSCRDAKKRLLWSLL